MTSITLPQLSISMEEATVVQWLVDDGAAVTSGQPIVEVETDKATMEVEASADGILAIVARPGAVVPVDGVLAEIAVGGVTEVTPQRPPTSGGGEPSGRVVDEREAATVTLPRSRPIASPAARRLAAERGVELAALAGSGPGGRIVARDVLANGVRAGSGQVAPPLVGAPPPSTTPQPAAAPTPGGTGLRGAVVRSILASWQQIPHVHIGGELAADGLAVARAALPPAPVKVTMTDLLVVALSRALVEVPELNAVTRPDGSVVRSVRVDLSLAVATPDGVVAPVLRDAGSLTLAQVAAERARLVTAAREGRLDGRDLAGGTCTLSNLGSYPVDFFAPVISGPQVAMVATGRIAEQVVAENGGIAVRQRMWANVAVDHRAADGEAAGRLLAALERQIASLPGGLA